MLNQVVYEKIKSEIAASETIFSRGETLYSLGNYKLIEENLEGNEGFYRYEFDGNYGVYTVSLKINENSISSECDCPYPRRGCKHTVAALLDILQRNKRIDKGPADDLHDSLTPEEIRRIALESREKRAGREHLSLIRGETYKGVHKVQTESGKIYDVTIHSPEKRSGHCTCRDFATNHLDTCKHLIFVHKELRRDKAFLKSADGEVFPFVHLYWNSRQQKPVCYYERIEDETISKEIQSIFNEKGVYVRESLNRLEKLYLTYAESGILQFDSYLLEKMEEVLFNRETAKIKRRYKADYSFLKTELYPYQKEGVEFSLFKKSVIIGDEMGLGKTLQAITAAVLKKDVFGFRKVLVVSPSSVKDQWKREITRFTDESAVVVEGPADKRKEIYTQHSGYFKITNYEAVLRDFPVISRWRPDLIILDEAQRIKNFETKTYRAILSIPHNHSLVITGTPLENKLEDIYSIVQFSDSSLLTPLWAFAANHMYLSKSGSNKVLGYKNLDIVHEKLKNLVIRRTKEAVFTNLPKQLDKNYFLELSREQREIHQSLLSNLLVIVNKKVLTPMDIKRMQRILLSMRMVCNSTYLVDKDTNISPKLSELALILKDLVIDNKHKVLIFSEWTTMTYLISKVLSDMGIAFVDFSGKIPVKKRQLLVDEFQNNPECRVFLSTDAGGVGLNLQNADCLINFELPWNPARLNQRIGRINRIGQKSQSINVINLISRDSIEEKVYAGIQLKQELFDAVLEGKGDEVDFSRDSKNKFVNQIREMFGGEQPSEISGTVPAPEIEEDTPYYLNPEVLRDKEEEIDLQAEEMENEIPLEKASTGPSGENPSEKTANPQQLEEVLNQGLAFLNTLSQMATGKALTPSGEGQAVSIDEKTGEVVFRFKLPGF